MGLALLLGKLAAWHPNLLSLLDADFKNSLVEAGEGASEQAACREFATSIQQEVWPVSATEQIFDENGKPILQIDGGAVSEKAALILSKKTRILPSHVDQLESTIAAVKKFSPQLADLREFRGKEQYGK